MPDRRAGTVTAVQLPDEGSNAPVKYRIQTSDNKELRITAWGRLKRGDDWIDNPAASVKQGQTGTFVGESKEESYNNKTFKVFYAEDWVEGSAPSPNGQEAPASDDSSPLPVASSRDGSFALSYAKDIVAAMVETGKLSPEVKEIEGVWYPLADGALVWLKQNR